MELQEIKTQLRKFIDEREEVLDQFRDENGEVDPDYYCEYDETVSDYNTDIAEWTERLLDALEGK